MKTLFFVVLLTGATKCFGQPDSAVIHPDTPITYSGVINIDGVLKAELFTRARDWYCNNFQGLQIQDNETGELSGKGMLMGPIEFRLYGSQTANARFIFNINVWVKDGRYMYRISNINNNGITYENHTTTNMDDTGSSIGILYSSPHCKVRVLGLSQARSDETYLSSKKIFDKLVKELIDSLISTMKVQSTPVF